MNLIRLMQPLLLVHDQETMQLQEQDEAPIRFRRQCHRSSYRWADAAAASSATEPVTTVSTVSPALDKKKKRSQGQRHAYILCSHRATMAERTLGLIQPRGLIQPPGSSRPATQMWHLETRPSKQQVNVDQGPILSTSTLLIQSRLYRIDHKGRSRRCPPV